MKNCLLVLVLSVSLYSMTFAERLYSNAANNGLNLEGLRTGPRPGGGDYSEVQFGNGAAGWSFRQWTARLADDFTVPAGGWMIQKFTTFGFQIGVQGATVNLGAIEICNGSFDGPIVAVGSFGGSELTDIYRIFNGRPDMEYQIQKVTYFFNAKLAPGNYWIRFSANGNMGFSGPWCPTLTKVGSLTVPGANAWQRQSSWKLEWVPLLDVQSLLPQDLPFWIDGYRLPIKVKGGDQQIQGPTVPPPTLFQQAFDPLMETQ